MLLIKCIRIQYHCCMRLLPLFMVLHYSPFLLYPLLFIWFHFTKIFGKWIEIVDTLLVSLVITILEYFTTDAHTELAKKYLCGLLYNSFYYTISMFFTLLNRIIWAVILLYLYINSLCKKVLPCLNIKMVDLWTLLLTVSHYGIPLRVLSGAQTPHHCLTHQVRDIRDCKIFRHSLKNSIFKNFNFFVKTCNVCYAPYVMSVAQNF